MELSQLRYVIKLAETANFSKAADQVYITQPALSQQINALEDELGLKLFTRTTRKVTLTDAGKEFVQGAQKVLADMDDLSRTMALRRREIGGTLSVGLLSTLSHLNIPEYIHGFHQLYPNINLELKVAWSSELINRILNRELDVAITNIFFNQRDKPNSNLVIRVFLEDYIVVVASKRRHFSKLDFLTIEDICEHPVIALEPQTSIRMEMNDIFFRCSVSPRITCNCPNMDSLITMVRADMGITFLSSGVAQSYLENDLVCIPLHPIFRTQTAMITRKRTGTSVDALQYFEDYFYGIIH